MSASPFPEPRMQCLDCGRDPHGGPCEPWLSYLSLAASSLLVIAVLVWAVAQAAA